MPNVEFDFDVRFSTLMHRGKTKHRNGKARSFFSIKMNLLDFILVCLVSGSLADPTKLINVNFVGKGYDIFLGNPQADIVDPGFRQPVAQITYDNVRTFDP